MHVATLYVMQTQYLLTVMYEDSERTIYFFPFENLHTFVLDMHQHGSVTYIRTGWYEVTIEKAKLFSIYLSLFSYNLFAYHVFTNGCIKVLKALFLHLLFVVL